MISDPTDEIKAIRRKLAAKFDNDVSRIGADVRRQQRESGRTYIMLPKREPVLAHASSPPVSKIASVSTSGSSSRLLI